MISDLRIDNPGLFHYKTARYGTPTDASARFDLFIIKQAWNKGCDFEQEADGFGSGMGTMGGDWSGIRDSSDEAITKMLEKALNFLFSDS